MTTSPARNLAFDVLRRVEEHGAHADVELGERLVRVSLGDQDRALATRLVYGSLAWQGRLDWHLARLCTTPPERCDPWLRVILRMGLYQILFLDRVPPYAAVDTAVALARRFRHGAASGLVNATLRRAADGRATLPLPDASGDPIGHLAVRWSHPRWLVERWTGDLGASEVAPLLQADQEAAPTVLRVNTLATGRSAVIEALGKIAARPTRFSPDGVVIEGPLAAADHLPEAWVTPQSEASQLITHLVAPRPGDRVLDACAVPGGKTTHLAALMANRGEIVAVDVNERGLAILSRRAAALGIAIVQTRVADARTIAGDLPSGGTFDRILVDAPCSGLGTLRAHPEIRWRVRESDIVELARLQTELLDGVAPLCAPGGALVYSVCTLTQTENDGVIERFLCAHPAFTVDDPSPGLPENARALIDDRGALRTFPHRHGLDGFFAVRLRRRPA